MTVPYTMIPAKSEEEPAELFIMGDIVEGAMVWPGESSPVTIQEAIANCGSNSLTVHIDSYGGFTSAGIAIYNLLHNCGKAVTTICEGFACSSASLIFMAGSVRQMRSSSLLMIHNAWTTADGNAEQLRKAAEDLDTISASSAKIYEENCCLTAEEVKALMDAETWIDAETAVEYGMATEVVGACKPDDDDDKSKSYSSAFNAIRSCLTAKTAEDADLIEGELCVSKLDTDDIAEKVAERLTGVIQEALAAKQRLDAEDLPEKPEQPEETNKPKTALSWLFG